MKIKTTLMLVAIMGLSLQAKAMVASTGGVVAPAGATVAAGGEAPVAAGGGAPVAASGAMVDPT